MSIMSVFPKMYCSQKQVILVSEDVLRISHLIFFVQTFLSVSSVGRSPEYQPLLKPSMEIQSSILNSIILNSSQIVLPEQQPYKGKDSAWRGVRMISFPSFQSFTTSLLF